MKNEMSLDFSQICRQHVDIMSPERTNQELLSAWKRGDQNAAAQVFRRYQARLLALVRSRLSKKLARRVDAEDILLSAYRSFFVGVQAGRCTPNASDELWPLLTTIVLRKLARQARYHKAECRSFELERQDESRLLESLISQAPTTEHAAILTDEIELLLSHLDATAREVLVRTLQGQDVPSIGNELNLHERTVRRALELIRQLIPSSANDSFDWAKISLRTKQRSPISRTPKVTVQGTLNYGDYLLKRLVGAGAFSKVYCAKKRASNETVAIKYLRKDCLQDPRAAEALVREYQILRQLNHPGILPVHGWGTTPGGSLFLVTDFIEGSNLATWKSTIRPSLNQILVAVREVAAAVVAAHSKGIIHGDLKPANVLIGVEGRITLCDFGLSRHVTDREDVPRGGTAGFLAPEQISDAFGPVTEVTDVYGMGALLYALLTERPPMTGRDFPDILANVLSPKLPEAPLKGISSLSSQLNSLTLRCLQKEPQRRFSSMLEFSLVLATIGDQ